jgi:periplasmic copper chaperone A
MPFEEMGDVQLMMKTTVNKISCTVAFFVVVVFGATVPVLAHDYTADGLKIDHPWARPTIGTLRVTAAYLILENQSGKSDKLVSASAAIADRVELHESVVEDGVVKMKHLPNGLEIPSGEKVELKPKGLHLMVMGLKQPLAVGDSFPMTLKFADRGDVDVEVKIEMGVDKSPPSADDGHGAHQGHH